MVHKAILVGGVSMGDSFKSGALFFIVVVIFILFSIGAGRSDATLGSDEIISS